MPPSAAASAAAALACLAALQLVAGESLNASWYWQCPQPAPTVPPQYTPYPKACPTSTLYPWCDPTSDVEYRVERLVERLTFTELAAQVSCDIFDGVPAIPALGVNAYNYIRENNHGLLWYGVCPVPTLFPQVISMAAAFNQTLWTAAGEASAIEVRYNYDAGKQSSLFTQTNFNIAVDPRWGRTQEVPGESPELNAAYAAAWVQGVQAPRGPRGVPLAGTSCKHWTAYSMEGGSGWPTPQLPDSNRHNFNANLSQQDLADTHFPVYEVCAQVGALGMMSSYNAVNGVPMAANGNLTNAIARKKWGFKGAVVTDCGAVEDMWMRHKYVPGPVEAAEAALRGGTDIECGKTIKSNASASVEPLLRKAVTNSFRVRFLLGEFDPPESAAPPTPAATVPAYDPAPHAKLAYEAAVQGSVLLKNAASTLPLRKGAKVALLGPLRDGKWEMLGNYAGYWNGADWTDSPNVVSPREGLQSSPAVGKLVLPPVQPPVCASTDELVAGTGVVTSPPEDADAVVIVAGLLCQDPLMQDPDKRPLQAASCEAGCLESEGCDRPDLLLPRGQRQLIRRAAGWGLPVVLVLISGGPLDVSEFEEEGSGVGAILWMGYPGQAAGTALAALLFGQESPSGRLSQTFYRSAYLKKVSIKDMAMRPHAATGYPGRGYRFVDPKYVLYPFGHGLTYQQWAFELGAPGASPSDKTAKFQTCSLTIKASVSDCPKGSQPQATLLLFFVPPTSAHASAPKQVLRHFAAVRGPSGQASFVLNRTDFELADKEGKFVLAEGSWVVELGVPATLRVKVSVAKTGCEVGKTIPVSVPGKSASAAGHTKAHGKSSRVLAQGSVRGISAAYAATPPGVVAVQLEATRAGGAWSVSASQRGVLATMAAAMLAAGVLAVLARSRTVSPHEGAHLLGAEASE